MKYNQFEDITAWQLKTFGEANALSKLTHLKEELQELTSDLKSNAPGKRLEWADCFILLFGAAASDGMSYFDVCDAIDEKMAINYKRQWGTPKENGVVNHIK